MIIMPLYSTGAAARAWAGFLANNFCKKAIMEYLSNEMSIVGDLFSAGANPDQFRYRLTLVHKPAHSRSFKA
jgi:hypothetical protein